MLGFSVVKGCTAVLTYQIDQGNKTVFISYTYLNNYNLVGR